MFQVTIRKLAVVWLLPILLLASCGYSLVGRGTALPPDIRSVSIPIFANSTGEPDIERIITQKVRDRFILDGRLEVAEGSSAISVLSGKIEKYQLRPLSYDTQNNVTSYLTELTISVTHKTSSGGRILSRRKVDTKETYQVDASVAGTEGERIAALERAAKTAAESILSLVVEAF